MPYGLPESQMNPLYDKVTALFISEERGVAGRRNNVDWLEEQGFRAPAQDRRDLYQKLWGTKSSKVEVPNLGEPSEPVFALAEPGLSLDSGEVIPAAGASDCLVYLGCNVSPWAGVTIKDTRASLASTLGRVQQHHEVDLMSTYIVPHYLYQLAIAMTSIAQIKLMDQELRVVLQNILHLPQATTNALLYCGKRDGELGIPRLEWLATSSALKAGLKFADNLDPTMRALATGTKLESCLRCMTRRPDSLATHRVPIYAQSIIVGDSFYFSTKPLGNFETNCV
nr:unnamed protein product [Callosobruchus analis]